jgi:hypothetical protein
MKIGGYWADGKWGRERVRRETRHANAPEAGGHMLRLDWHRHLWTSVSMLISDERGR